MSETMCSKPSVDLSVFKDVFKDTTSPASPKHRCFPCLRKRRRGRSRKGGTAATNLYNEPEGCWGRPAIVHVLRDLEGEIFDPSPELRRARLAVSSRPVVRENTAAWSLMDFESPPARSIAYVVAKVTATQIRRLSQIDAEEEKAKLDRKIRESTSRHVRWINQIIAKAHHHNAQAADRMLKASLHKAELAVTDVKCKGRGGFVYELENTHAVLRTRCPDLHAAACRGRHLPSLNLKAERELLRHKLLEKEAKADMQREQEREKRLKAARQSASRQQESRMRREARKLAKKSLTTRTERIHQKYEDQLNHDELRANKSFSHSYLLAEQTREPVGRVQQMRLQEATTRAQRRHEQRLRILEMLPLKVVSKRLQEEEDTMWAPDPEPSSLRDERTSTGAPAELSFWEC